jgi:hypothetical protein
MGPANRHSSRCSWGWCTRFSFSVISAGFAIALGFRQTAGEAVRETWLFLLHRPLRRRRLFAVSGPLAVDGAVGGALRAAGRLVHHQRFFCH